MMRLRFYTPIKVRHRGVQQESGLEGETAASSIAKPSKDGSLKQWIGFANQEIWWWELLVLTLDDCSKFQKIGNCSKILPCVLPVKESERVSSINVMDHLNSIGRYTPNANTLKTNTAKTDTPNANTLKTNTTKTDIPNAHTLKNEHYQDRHFKYKHSWIQTPMYWKLSISHLFELQE